MSDMQEKTKMGLRTTHFVGQKKPLLKFRAPKHWIISAFGNSRQQSIAAAIGCSHLYKYWMLDNFFGSKVWEGTHSKFGGW